MKIRHVRNDDEEPVREFYLVARVRFRDRPAEDGGSKVSYYDDNELRGLIEEWTGGALEDRDDSPAISFRSLPEILVTDADSVFRGDYPGHEDGDET